MTHRTTRGAGNLHGRLRLAGAGQPVEDGRHTLGQRLGLQALLQLCETLLLKVLFQKIQLPRQLFAVKHRLFGDVFGINQLFVLLLFFSEQFKVIFKEQFPAFLCQLHGGLGEHPFGLYFNEIQLDKLVFLLHQLLSPCESFRYRIENVI